MKYINIKDGHPIKDVDVFVVTDTGAAGTARYWTTTGKWLTNDESLSVSDTVVKWKYADASKFMQLRTAINNYLNADTPAFKEQYLKEIKEHSNEC